MKIEEANIKESLGEVVEKLTAAAKALEVLEGALFAARDRRDKDFTRPCAATAEMVGKIVEECADYISDLCERSAG